jgi:hypothetical protein
MWAPLAAELACHRPHTVIVPVCAVRVVVSGPEGG